MEPLRSSLGQSDEDPVLADLALLTNTLAKHGAAEVSSDVALDVVLHELAERASVQTGASGAAIALWRGDAMICRASSGTNAPELGVALELRSGLTGACVRTLEPQLCLDTEKDPRVDAAACGRLGVRSLVVTPIIMDGSNLAGIFEIFSSNPHAFSEADTGLLAYFSSIVAQSLEEANRATARAKPEPVVITSQEPNPQLRPIPVPESLQVVPIAQRSESPSSDVVTAVLGVLIVLVALVLGLLIGWRVGWQRAVIKAAARSRHGVATTPSAPGKDARWVNPGAEPANVVDQKGVRNHSQAAHAVGNVNDIAGLVVYQKGKVVYRMQAAQLEQPFRLQNKTATPGTAAAQSLMTAVPLSEADAQQRLVHRVEPLYPAAARVHGLSGDVVLLVQINAGGTVESVGVVQGDPILAASAMSAVRQWKYRPYVVGNQAVPVQTRVTVHLPPR